MRDTVDITVELSSPPRHIFSSSLILTLTSQCGLTLVFFIAGMCGCMSTIEEAMCATLVFCRSVGTFLVWMSW